MIDEISICPTDTLNDDHFPIVEDHIVSSDCCNDIRRWKGHPSLLEQPAPVGRRRGCSALSFPEMQRIKLRKNDRNDRMSRNLVESLERTEDGQTNSPIEPCLLQSGQKESIHSCFWSGHRTQRTSGRRERIQRTKQPNEAARVSPEISDSILKKIQIRDPKSKEGVYDEP